MFGWDYVRFGRFAESMAHLVDVWRVIVCCCRPAPLTYLLEPPAFLLHLWRPDVGLVTHTCLVDSFPGPYSF